MHPSYWIYGLVVSRNVLILLKAGWATLTWVTKLNAVLLLLSHVSLGNILGVCHSQMTIVLGPGGIQIIGPSAMIWPARATTLSTCRSWALLLHAYPTIATVHIPLAYVSPAIWFKETLVWRVRNLVVLMKLSTFLEKYNLHFHLRSADDWWFAETSSRRWMHECFAYLPWHLLTCSSGSCGLKELWKSVEIPWDLLLLWPAPPWFLTFLYPPVEALPEIIPSLVVLGPMAFLLLRAYPVPR